MKTSKPDIEIGDDIVEGANLALSNNLAVIVAVLGLVIVVLAGLLFSVRGKLNALQSKYDFFTQGEEANIDTVLTKTLNELHKSQAELAVLQEKHAKLQEQVQGCLQNVKLIRYDAFDAMGGEMSYSILLTDAKKDGLLLTSIYGREESRCYAKDIKGGKSSYPLAEEEQKLL